MIDCDRGVQAIVQRADQAALFLERLAACQARLEVRGGVATFPEDGETPTLLLRHADAQLYDAKTRRQRSRRATPGADEKSQKKIAKLF